MSNGPLSAAERPPALFSYRPFWAKRFGTAPFLPMSRAEMEELKSKLKRHSAEMEALSAQERTIAELAAAGHSNKQIAAQLYLSPRTVGAHLYRIFPKLGITSRAGLAVALREYEAP